MQWFAQDVRYAVRNLLRARAFTVTALLTLGLGIGANTAIFSVVDAVLLRSLPFRAPDRLAAVWPGGGFARGNFDLFVARSSSYTSVGGIGSPTPLTLTGQGEPVRVAAATATASFLPTLGIEPLLGRTFTEEEQRPGGGAVVMLSEGVWRDRFGSDPGIIGRTVTLDGRGETVIGIMPAAANTLQADVQIWLPSVSNPADINNQWSGPGGLRLFGRLAPSHTTAGATSELRGIMPELRDAYPWDMPDDLGANATVVTLREHVAGEVRTVLLVLLGAVGLVLLVACANVANLTLVRATGRERELAVRAALGAGRRRIARQMLTESLVLAAAGGLAGTLFAVWGVPALVDLLPADTPRRDAIGIDVRVLAFTALLTLLTSVLFGMAPALRAARTELASALRQGNRGDGLETGQRRLSGLLVIAEVALAVVLVTGAGLFLRTLGALTAVDPGFATDQVVTATVAPPDYRFPDADARRGFYDELTRRLESLPGVRSASVSDRLPFGGRNYGSVFIIEEKPIAPGAEWPWADVRAVVSTDYHSNLEISLLEGRAFSDSDRSGNQRVALISRTLARRYWPEGSPLGKRFQFPASPMVTVVGVVDDVKWDGLAEVGRTALYVPLSQFDAAGEARLIIRTTGDTGPVLANLRDVVAAIDNATPVSDVRTLEQRIATSVQQPRFASVLLTLFAILALALGAIGIYGVIAYAVGRRTREIGVRMALGAHPGQVRRLILAQGLLMAGIGLALGLFAAFLAARALRGLLFGIGPLDPVTFLAAPLVLLATAFVAAWLPARRATRIDPLTALRGD
jgi:putative ABC transport system permease protein